MTKVGIISRALWATIKHCSYRICSVLKADRIRAGARMTGIWRFRMVQGGANCTGQTYSGAFEFVDTIMCLTVNRKIAPEGAGTARIVG